MKIIKETKDHLDEQDDSEGCLTTPPESVDDSITTEVTEEDHQITEVSGRSAVIDQSLNGSRSSTAQTT